MTAGGASAAKTKVMYDNFSSGNNSNWATTFGPGETAIGGFNHSLTFPDGTERVRAVPFLTGSDVSVFDHLKYIETSKATFPVPAIGSVQFNARIKAKTPGTITPLTQTGVYGPTGTWSNPLAPPVAPNYSASLLQGQEAGAVLNMIDFCTGQLFDWFVSGNTAFTLIERLPSSVSGNLTNPSCPDAQPVGLDKMYTQIVKQINIRPGYWHNVSIRYTRSAHGDNVQFRIDRKLITEVHNIGIPLDKQGVPFTGTYPSLGNGEILRNQIHSFSIGHGLFSVVDAFPFQYPDAPDASVSIPVGTANPADAGRARLFGQGADAHFDDFLVTTVTRPSS